MRFENISVEDWRWKTAEDQRWKTTENQRWLFFAIKIPLIWPSDLTCMLWFMKVEAQFWPRGITAQVTKFNHVLANLSQDIATEVRDLLMYPPVENPYDTLKETLIERTMFSEQQQL